MKHKHADLIHAWADGAEIQVKGYMGWLDVPAPNWESPQEYRIKPEEKKSYNPEDFRVDTIMQKLGSFAPCLTSGVRITHIPTGLSVESTSERSQHRNRAIAFEQLEELLNNQPEEKKPVVRWLWVYKSNSGVWRTSMRYMTAAEAICLPNPIKLEWSRTEFPS